LRVEVGRQSVRRRRVSEQVAKRDADSEFLLEMLARLSQEERVESDLEKARRGRNLLGRHAGEISEDALDSRQQTRTPGRIGSEGFFHRLHLNGFDLVGVPAMGAFDGVDHRGPAAAAVLSADPVGTRSNG
jgi:hypothetical protein